ncbi:glycosyltransferase [Pseudoalteromonas mariniglutinosa]|uniref:glycosyltransferase family A protein n=1 Tax=Pseudoalteromonas mariniglutinosa TaxID=206042 RepID=UPI00384AEBE8
MPTAVKNSTANSLTPIYEFLLRFAASGFIPGHWFISKQPKKHQLTAKSGKLHIEIVSHCWQYSQFLSHQLASISHFPPTSGQLTFTLFYSSEDEATVALVAQYQAISIERVTWNFQAIDTPQLLRRAIGRNRAAKHTQADWIWFTDCDVLFLENCLDSLNQALQNRNDILVFPQQLKATCLLKSNNQLLQPTCESIKNTEFKHREFKKATGPIQIVHGDVAREVGYCDSLNVYQQPKERWVKTYEDRAFRWLLGTHGTPIQLKNLYLIRHEEKGRYKKDSEFSKLRQAIRKIKSDLTGR